MVQLTSPTRPSCGPAPRNSILLCRGARSCVRSASVRCFKGGLENIGSKLSGSLRLNFKIPYRVNFGQSLGLVGSGDVLGNWDPKRTVPMKWTDGDWWTVELSISSGGSLDLEYKYVVINMDGNVGYWKPGSNYRVTLPLNANGVKLPRRVKVADAWDDSFKKVDIEEAEAQAAASSRASSTQSSSAISSTSASTNGASSSSGGGGASTPAKPLSIPVQVGGRQQVMQGPSLDNPAAAPAATAAVASSTTIPLAQPAAAPAPVAQATATASHNGTPPPSPQPQAEAVAPGAAGVPPLAKPQPSMAAATPPSSSSPPPPSNVPPRATSPPPRATSPRMAPPSFAAATTIPVIHPSLLAEQERLEDGVRNSLEDLQAQMDKHQQLRERTDDPAAVEVLVADRIVAAANNRVVAYNKALKAVQEYNRLPPSASAPKDAASDHDK